MKRALVLFISFILFINCSDSSSVSPNNAGAVLPKKIVYHNPENVTIDYTYNGNKIDKIKINNSNYFKYTYTGDLITRIDEYDSQNVATGNYEIYFYTNNKIMQEKSYSLNLLDNIKDYVYNSDGSISIINSDSSGNYSNRGGFKEFYDTSGNCFKTEYWFQGKITQTDYLTYDNKNNPYKNIIGYSVFYSSLNNVSIGKQVFSNGTDYLYNNVYTYNSDGFPTNESTIENPAEFIEYFYYNAND